MKKLRLVVPKGKIYENVASLLNDAGIGMKADERAYRPTVSDHEVEIKMMKPQNIPELVEIGSHDAGFTGYDWTIETGAEVTEILDLKFDPVKIVVAVPKPFLKRELKRKLIVVASEYERMAKKYLEREKYKYVFLRTYGANRGLSPRRFGHDYRQYGDWQDAGGAWTQGH